MTVELLRNVRTGAAYARFIVRGHWDDREVSVVGPFNDWTPGVDVLAPQRDGSRSLTIPVPDGVDVHFRYLATGNDWFDDPDADRVDEHGSTVFWNGAAAKKAPAKRTAAQTQTAAQTDTAASGGPAGTGGTAKAPAKKAPAKKAAAKKRPSPTPD
jgi:hypothetical protein